jgi:hypothetical protein
LTCPTRNANTPNLVFDPTAVCLESEQVCRTDGPNTPDIISLVANDRRRDRHSLPWQCGWTVAVRCFHGNGKRMNEAWNWRCAGRSGCRWSNVYGVSWTDPRQLRSRPFRAPAALSTRWSNSQVLWPHFVLGERRMSPAISRYRPSQGNATPDPLGPIVNWINSI